MQPPLTRKELAKKYGVGMRTVDSWVTSRRIAHLKIGGMVKFTEKHIAEFEKAHTVKAIS